MSTGNRPSLTPIVDLFAGPGGWDEGLKTLGVTDVVGLELDSDACATAEAAGHRREQVDVSAICPAAYAGADGLIASPPCQDYSSAGRRGDSGTAHLVGEVLRWARALSPRWIVCEQVRDVLPVWEDYADRLVAHGYLVAVGLVNAADYGVPQHRWRAILLAHKNRQPALPPRTRARQHTLDGLEPWLTMEDALGWKGTLDRRNNGAPIIRTDRPSPTVTGAGVGAGQWLYTPDGGETRAVTPEEGGVLQTFPHDYPWHGNKKERGQQVGNAVPPTMAAEILRPFVSTALAEEVAA